MSALKWYYFSIPRTDMTHIYIYISVFTRLYGPFTLSRGSVEDCPQKNNIIFIIIDVRRRVNPLWILPLPVLYCTSTPSLTTSAHFSILGHMCIEFLFRVPPIFLSISASSHCLLRQGNGCTVYVVCCICLQGIYSHLLITHPFVFNPDINTIFHLAMTGSLQQN